ncbi:double-strand break repair helicase AddA [Brevirhabdus sp.]|uniref:double-strand break repair helicase AddA n=1 Tax=Brevirhabdus sp. TaxID=2004514 RepID=UPI004058C19C
MIRDDATEAQVRAAAPYDSTWLSANAGSGKTRVLTDRVARLLLKGVPPERILCLTYTKAAASEMQNRLFRRLGEWAMLEDRALAAELDTLGVEVSDNSPTARRHARTLFARAIETPGGLKIQTIHSFCAALLRRFPLEAGVSPQFTEMDDRAGKILRDEVLEELADGPHVGLVDGIARHLSGDDPADLLQEIAANAELFARPLEPADLKQALGLARDANAVQACAIAFDGGEADLLATVCPLLDGESPTMKTLARALRGLDMTSPGLSEHEALCALMLRKADDLPKPSLLTKNARKALGPLADEVMALAQRVADAKLHLQAIDAAEKARCLCDFARVFLPEYEDRKLRLGWLDFDDLILKARRLLTDPSVAQWVLFRLDGGIDHILVDEAQDTSPAQWDVVRLLTQEFTAGVGARADTERTIFVVGDKKQSIYSFQGADPAAFDRMRGHFDQQLSQVGKRLFPRDLLFSFRSATPILRLVDQAFSGEAAQGVGGETHHRAFRSDLPGRVDLWPVVEKSDTPEEAHWTDPVDRLGADDPNVVLARRIAQRIGAMIGTPLPDGKGGTRPIRAGDFLILVQRRRELFHEIIRAGKEQGLPMAGSDRLRLGGELAVRDLSALLAFLATNEDDLSLAAALRSPLFGWDEAQIYDLAQGRGKSYLWAQLRARHDSFAQTLAVLQDLRDNTDFLRPFDLLERILTRHGGRQRLLAQLGPEAQDGIDALQAQALAYERSDIPSLTGFLGWLASDDVDIKRQLDSNSDLIRVMSVHGAKGLEAPIVILPETQKRKNEVRNEILKLDTQEGPPVPVWKTGKNQSPLPMTTSREAQERRQLEERMRLLYVAITRAEQWLIVAAAGDVGTGPESWYNIVQDAMQHDGAAPLIHDGAAGLRLQFGHWPADPPAAAEPGTPPTDRPDVGARPLPAYAVTQAAVPPRPAAPLSPSELGGAKALAGEGQDEATALRRGRSIHMLLELLPALPTEERHDTGIALLAAGPDRAQDDEARALLAEAVGVLDAPQLAALFRPETLAEVEVAARLPDGRQLRGIVDRLIVTQEAITIVDFKTNRMVPETPDAVPDGLLRQMGAYAFALGEIHPGRRIECAILWTRSAQLMPLPRPLLERALQAALAEDVAP